MLRWARPNRQPAPSRTGKINFIAAARRAAQAASREKRATSASPPASGGKLASIMNARVRALLVRASAGLIVIGALLFAVNWFSLDRSSSDFVQTAAELPQPEIGSTMADAPAAADLPQDLAEHSGRYRVRPCGFGGIDTVGAIAGDLYAHTDSRHRPFRAGLRRFDSSSPAGANVELGGSPSASPPPVPPPEPGKLPAAIGTSALRSAALMGNPAAEYMIAVRYAEGRGVPQDLTAAAQWFERAAAQGLAPAQFRLGGLYQKGFGVKKSLDTARRLYAAAAAAGNAKAMHNLAVLYAEGVDGKPDYDTAAKWFRQAADDGMRDSQYNLGILYARGIGVAANLTEAYKWFTLAAREGDKEIGCQARRYRRPPRSEVAQSRQACGARMEPAAAARGGDIGDICRRGRR